MNHHSWIINRYAYIFRSRYINLAYELKGHVEGLSAAGALEALTAAQYVRAICIGLINNPSWNPDKIPANIRKELGL